MPLFWWQDIGYQHWVNTEIDVTFHNEEYFCTLISYVFSITILHNPSVIHYDVFQNTLAHLFLLWVEWLVFQLRRWLRAEQHMQIIQIRTNYNYNTKCNLLDHIIIEYLTYLSGHIMINFSYCIRIIIKYCTLSF